MAPLLALLLVVVPPDEEKADRLKEQAFEAIAQKDYRRAVELFEIAHRAVPHPTFLFNLAVAYDVWGGHCKESIEAFDRFFGECGTCSVRPQAEARHRNVRARCIATLEVDSEPSGAEIALDAAKKGWTPARLEIVAGTYALSTTLDGHQPTRQTVTVDPGESVSISVPLEKIELAPTPPPPVVTEAETTIDPLPFVSFGVGAAVLGLGIAFGVLSQNAISDEQAERAKTDPDGGRVLDLRGDAKRNAWIANISFGAAAVAVALGLVFWFVGDDAATPQDDVLAWSF